MAVTEEKKCLCGNKSPDRSFIVSDHECSRPCPGNSEENCGNEEGDHLNVYTVNGFKMEAIKMTIEFETFINTKIQEYGNLNTFETAYDKLVWIKTDLENHWGNSWETIMSEHNNKKKFESAPIETQHKLHDIDSILRRHISNIIDYPEQYQGDSLKEYLQEMEHRALEISGSDRIAQQAAHHGIQAAILLIGMVTKDENGMHIHDKIIAAINKNTRISSFLRKNKNTRTEQQEKNCLKESVREAAKGAMAGCAWTWYLPPEGATCLEAGGFGLAIGFFTEGAVCSLEKAYDTVETGCLATTTTVETAMGKKEISDLEIGEYVKTYSSGDTTEFTKFLGWMDRDQSKATKMLKIWTSNEHSPLTLTRSHIVFTSTTTKYAGDLQPGDCLLHWNGTSMEEMDIDTISPTISFGYWSPLTKAGHLLVDGYLTSCYASYPHQVADMAMTPIKMMPRILLDDDESQHKDGVRNVIKLIKGVGRLIGARRKDDIVTKEFPVSLVNSIGMKSEF